MLPPDPSDWANYLNGDLNFDGAMMVGLEDPFLQMPSTASFEGTTQQTNPSTPYFSATNINTGLSNVDGSIVPFPNTVPPVMLQPGTKGRRHSEPLPREEDSPASSSPRTMSTDSACNSPRRDAHMASEQRRRAQMGQSFEQLKRLLPNSEYRKPSKANILQATVNYVEYLQRQERNLKAKVVFLQRENMILGQQLHGGPHQPYPSSMNRPSSVSTGNGVNPAIAPAPEQKP